MFESAVYETGEIVYKSGKSTIYTTIETFSQRNVLYTFGLFFFIKLEHFKTG